MVYDPQRGCVYDLHGPPHDPPKDPLTDLLRVMDEQRFAPLIEAFVLLARETHLFEEETFRELALPLLRGLSPDAQEALATHVLQFAVFTLPPERLQTLVTDFRIKAGQWQR